MSLSNVTNNSTTPFQPTPPPKSDCCDNLVDTIRGIFSAEEREKIQPQNEPVDDYVVFAKQFIQDRKANKINIFTTHIPFFAEWIVKNFEAFYPENVPCDEWVEKFRAEMKDRIKEKKVTYEWWLVFNMRLSILMTPKEVRSTWVASFQDNTFEKTISQEGWKDHDQSKSSLTDYLNDTDYVFIPSYLGDFTIDSLNKTVLTGAFLVGLISKPKMVDGRLMYPDQYFRHDLVHYSNESYAGGPGAKNVLKAKEKFFAKRSIELDPNRIQLLDFIFFYATHERPNPGFDVIEECMKSSNQDEIVKLLAAGEFYRSDWYKDHMPKPECLNVKSIAELKELGARSFINWIGEKTVSTEVKSCPDDRVHNFRIPPNLDSTETFVTLSQSQLDLYNKFVIAVNNGESLSDLRTELQNAGDALNEVIQKQGITRLFK